MTLGPDPVAQPPSAAEVPKLRIAHVVHSIAPEFGGPSVTVPRLCQELGALGHSVRLHVTRYGGAPLQRSTHFELRSHPFFRVVSHWGVSLGMHSALAAEARSAAVVHSHGLWLGTNLEVHWATRNRPARVMLSPRGMLEPYALSRRRLEKRALWALGQGAAVRAAHCIHVTSYSEYESVRALGLTNPVAIVANGVEIPECSATFQSDRQVLLFLGRLDHKKGLDLLIHAWSKIAPSFPNWDLQIVGPGEPEYVRTLRELAARLGAARLTFMEPRFGTERDACLRAADLFVLPTRSENFGMTVAESLAAGVPVVCTKEAPWDRLQAQKCGWWIDVGAEPLVKCLEHALALPKAELKRMGIRGRAWMEAEFSWSQKASQLARVYRWLAGEASAPDLVSFS